MQQYLQKIKSVVKGKHHVFNNGDRQKVDKLREMEQSLVINTSFLNNKLQLKNISVSNEKLPLSNSCKTKKVSNACE